jgi:hypothetical protein
LPSEPPYQVYGSQPGVQVYATQAVPVSIPQPLSVYAPSPLPVVAAQPGLQVYLIASQLQTLNPSDAPFQVYGSQPGVQVYGNVGVAQPVSVYFNSVQPVNIVSPNPVQVYGNVGVFQPVSVYYTTPQKVIEAQPVQVYGSAGLAPVNVYDTQVISDANQTFAGQIGAGSGLNSQIVAAGGSGLSLSATLIDIWNIYGAAETVALRFGSAGQFRFIKKLNPNTGFVVNLINSAWRGPTNTGLYVYTWETMGGPLSPSGGFVTYTVMGQYLP